MAALLVSLMDRELDGGARRSELARMGIGDLESVLAFAVRAAAVTVSRAGANPPTRSDLT